MLVAITATMQKNKDVRFATAQAELQARVEVPGDERRLVHRADHLLHDLPDAARRRATTDRSKTRTYSGDSSRAAGSTCSTGELPAHAERVAAEAVEHAMAKPVGAGVKDLVLMPSHLALTIHEIIAHPTELDRIVGYEANYAGTSFITLKDLGKLKYGSKLFNIYADRTHPGGMATVGYRR